MPYRAPSVAVVGAGVSGLAAARALVELGARARVFDKGRSVGGRLAVRRSGAHVFDLGTQYFTARDPGMDAPLRGWLAEGAVAPWRPRVVAFDEVGLPPREVESVDRYVGVPDMNALAHAMARGLDVERSHRVERIEQVGGALELRGTIGQEGLTLSPAEPDPIAPDRLGRFDAVLLCMPPAQAATLAAHLSPSLRDELDRVRMQPCYALGFAPGEADAQALATLPFDAAFVGRDGDTPASALSWIARDSSKPGRPPGERWVLHASPTWSRAMFDAPAEEVTVAMLGELSRLLKQRPLRPAQSFLRRWAHARVVDERDGGALFDAGAHVGAAGDWALGGRLEGAYLSGVDLARRTLDALG